MERLTRSANDGVYTYTACEATIGEILSRLTEYEDTGMTPEEIEDMKGWHPNGAAPHVPGRVDRRTVRNRGGMDASHGTV